MNDNDSMMVPPFSWVFRSTRSAMLWVLGLMTGGWVLLILSRKLIWDNELILWAHEFTLLVAFCYAGCLSPWLAKNLHQLVAELSGKHAEFDALLANQSAIFHQRRWLVVMPPILSAVAISLRFFAMEYLRPYRNDLFEYGFLAWVFLGFCFILNAAVLCGRYTELIRQCGEATLKGILGRQELNRISRFYFRIAISTSIFFAFAAFTVFSMELIYTYSGSIWPGYGLLRRLPGIFLERRVQELSMNMEVFYEVLFIGLLYLAACLSSLAYFVIPQWGVHSLLAERKKRVLEVVETRYQAAENAMIADPGETACRKFADESFVKEHIERLPEWPFSGEGWTGTLLLLFIPGILVLAKEIFLETLVSLLTK